MYGVPNNRGIVPNGILMIFDETAKADDLTTYLVRCSFYEIYNESIRDLLTGEKNLQLKETKDRGVWI